MFSFKLCMSFHISIESADLRYNDAVVNKQNTVCGIPGSLLTVNVFS